MSFDAVNLDVVVGVNFGLKSICLDDRSFDAVDFDEMTFDAVGFVVGLDVKLLGSPVERDFSFSAANLEQTFFVNVSLGNCLTGVDCTLLIVGYSDL